MPAESDAPAGNAYTQVIDLTTKAQREAKAPAAGMQEPEDTLPPVTLDELPDTVRHAAEAAGWPSLTAVQQKAIPYMLDGRDLIVQSRTGSGKTGAFLLPLFDMLDPHGGGPQALILTPTRELARQINEEFERMRGDTEGLETALIYGGVRYGPQIKALKEGAPVVVGTPGRILDLIERRHLQFGDAFRVLILDEADEMLSMGFYPAMRKLKRYLPRERRSYMFSATMPPKVRSLGNDFLTTPGFLSLSAGQQSVSTIEHRYYRVDPMEKDRSLIKLIELENPDSAIIFSNTKRDVEYLATFLQNYGHDADEISGDLSQKAREAVMDRIRDGELRFLVATDVAARGIDISDLSHVFMYDVPLDPEYYLHRSGRTGRIGKTGTAIVLTTRADERSLLSIGRRYDIDLIERPLPTEEEVQDRISERLTVHLENALRDKTNIERERLERFVPLAEDLGREDPHLMAVLLDALYHELMHRPTDDADDADAAAKAVETKERHSRKSDRGRGGGGSRRSGNR